MKKQNNTQKAVLKMFAVITSFILFSFTVSASEMWLSVIKETTKEIGAMKVHESDSIKQTTKNVELALVKGNREESKFDKTKTAQKKKHLSYQKNSAQVKSFSSASFVFEEEKDSKLQFEPWMFNPNCWKARK